VEYHLHDNTASLQLPNDPRQDFYHQLLDLVLVLVALLLLLLLLLTAVILLLTSVTTLLTALLSPMMLLPTAMWWLRIWRHGGRAALQIDVHPAFVLFGRVL
jgi:hypothetical protein